MGLSPMVITVLCTDRIYDMGKINAIGIGWIFLCILLALPVITTGGIGLYQVWKTTKEKQELVQSDVELVEEWREKTKSKGIRNSIVGVMLAIVSVLPTITTFALRLANKRYVAYSYAVIFIFISAGVSLVGASIVKLILASRIKYNVVESEETGAEVVKKAKKKNKHRIIRNLVIAGVILVILVNVMSRGTWYIQPYIATIPSVEHRQLTIKYNENTGIYTIHNKKDSEFKILQLTDIHLGGSLLSYSKDIKALEAVYKLIEHTKPDLVVVTGDFVFPLGIESYSFNNYNPIMQFASFMRNIGIPWAFTYGNHDTEFVASHSEEELNHLFQSFSYKTTGSLLYSDKQPNVTGRSNQMLVIENGDGTINQALYLIDSNSYTKNLKINDYDYIHDDQVDWYADSLKELRKQYGENVSSLIFTHIPLQEYKEAYDKYKAGSKEVTYCFGEVGEKDEGICCSDYKSKLFDKAVEFGSTKGIFVGHDHYNTISLQYKKIQLTYGMSIDYLAMPGIDKKTKQRGGTLITLHKDSSIKVEQVPLTTIE